MRRFTIQLIQKKEKPEKIIEINFNANKQAIHYTLDKFLEAPKKYEMVALYDDRNKCLIWMKR